MKRDTFYFVLYCWLWALALFGIFSHDWWMFAPAAFLILLEHIGPKK